MPRWEADTQQRLVHAALDLYTEQGYARTTVADIAERVGVTPRTFFRHFPDKREVLFANGHVIREAIVEATESALTSLPAFEAVLVGVTAARGVFVSREFARAREELIATSEDLRERELTKLATISAALTASLVGAGTDEATARITADAGVAVFVEATRRWARGDDSPFGELVDQAAQLLRNAAATATSRP